MKKDSEFRSLSAVAEHTFDELPPKDLEEMQKKFVRAFGGAWMEAGTRKEPKTRGGKAAAGMPGRLAETLQAVRDAASLRDAADARGLAPSTIIKHLEELQELGKLEKKDFARILPAPNILEEINEAAEAVDSDKLTPIFNALHGRYSFETIRLARLAGK